MKTRTDYVTNSSSSSFIIRNNTDKSLTSEDVIRSLISGVLEDAKDRFVIPPHGEISYECGDHSYDGAFEMFIHNEVDGWTWSRDYSDGSVTVELEECHH